MPDECRRRRRVAGQAVGTITKRGAFTERERSPRRDRVADQSIRRLQRGDDRATQRIVGGEMASQEASFLLSAVALEAENAHDDDIGVERAHLLDPEEVEAQRPAREFFDGPQRRFGRQPDITERRRDSFGASDHRISRLVFELDLSAASRGWGSLEGEARESQALATWSPVGRVIVQSCQCQGNSRIVHEVTHAVLRSEIDTASEEVCLVTRFSPPRGNSTPIA